MIVYSGFKAKQNLGRTINWHPWTGCTKVSEACVNCSVDTDRDFSFHGYAFNNRTDIPNGTVILVTLLSDFFLEEADPYREGAWNIIKQNPNLIFLIITKRVARIQDCLPVDWGQGYENVILSVTVENNKRALERLPIFKTIPAKHKWLSICPLLEDLDLESVLAEGWIECLEVLGEKQTRGTTSIDNVRECKYEWVKKLSDQCKKYNIRFSLLAAGCKFILNNQVVRDNKICYGSKFADSLNLDVEVPITFYLKDLIKTI